MEEIKEKLKELNIEDMIWLTYLFISTFAIISNYYERNYIKEKNKNSYQKYKTINYNILLISLIIYLYFLYRSIKRYIKDNNKNKTNIIANTLFSVAALLTLLNEKNDNAFDINLN